MIKPTKWLFSSEDSDQPGIRIFTVHMKKPGTQVIKRFSCSTQMTMKFTMHIVGILTLISMINTTSESLKARKVFNFQHLVFYEQLKFHSQLS